MTSSKASQCASLSFQLLEAQSQVRHLLLPKIASVSGKATDNVNFTLVMGAVMAITEADMSRDEREELALHLIQRFIRGSENPEVSGKLGTYRLDSVDGGGTMLEAQRGQ